MLNQNRNLFYAICPMVLYPIKIPTTLLYTRLLSPICRPSGLVIRSVCPVAVLGGRRVQPGGRGYLAVRHAGPRTAAAWEGNVPPEGATVHGRYSLGTSRDPPERYELKALPWIFTLFSVGQP